MGVQIIRSINSKSHSIVTAIASRNQEKAKTWAAQHGIRMAFGSYDELIDSGEVDVIYNPLPNSLHAQWTLRAMEAGLDVLCEKPLSVNAAQAVEIQSAAKKTGRLVVEALMYRHHPQWAKVFELIHQDAIGKVSTLYSRFTFLLDDPQASPASKDLAGGALMDVGCYCMNFSRLIAGCEPAFVSAVERRGQVDNAMLGLLEFPNGILAHFETAIDNYERHDAQIAGTTGAIIMKNPWIPGDQPATITLLQEGKREKKIIVPAADSYGLEVDDFVNALKSGKSPKWGIDDAVANMKVIDALYLSARERRAVPINS